MDTRRAERIYSRSGSKTPRVEPAAYSCRTTAQRSRSPGRVRGTTQLSAHEAFPCEDPLCDQSTAPHGRRRSVAAQVEQVRSAQGPCPTIAGGAPKASAGTCTSGSPSVAAADVMRTTLSSSYWRPQLSEQLLLAWRSGVCCRTHVHV